MPAPSQAGPALLPPSRYSTRPGRRPSSHWTSRAMRRRAQRRPMAPSRSAILGNSRSPSSRSGSNDSLGQPRLLRLGSGSHRAAGHGSAYEPAPAAPDLATDFPFRRCGFAPMALERQPGMMEKERGALLRKGNREHGRCPSRASPNAPCSAMKSSRWFAPRTIPPSTTSMARNCVASRAASGSNATRRED